MTEIAFIEPKMLLILIAIPLFILLIWLGSKTRQLAMKKFSDIKLFQVINPDLVTKGKTSMMRQIIYGAAIGLIILGIARPGGNPTFIEEEIGKKGLDIMLMLDLSSSMAATDLQPSRLLATKDAVKKFIDQIKDDRIGLTVFAGSAALQAPLTQDYRTAKMMIDILSTNFLPVDGTAIGDGLSFTIDKIPKDQRSGAVIILLTDGENTKGKSPNNAIERAKKDGVIVYTIGLGSKEGAKIPDGKDKKGAIKYKEYRGEQVITKLDEPLLQKIAKQTNGKYYSAESAQALSQVYNEISRLTKKEVKEKKKKPVYQEYYVWVVLPGLGLLLVELFMGRQSAWIFRRKKTVILPDM